MHDGMSFFVLLLLFSIDSSAIRHRRHTAVVDDEQLLPGWNGEVAMEHRPNRHIASEDHSKKLWVQTIAWRPRAMVIHNIISAQEAQHIVNLSWPRMKRSEVVGPNNQSVLDDYRTSYGTFVSRYETEVIGKIQERVAWITRAPVSHQEDMQVLRYGIGQFYKRHTDSLEDDSPRMATLLIYLADPEEGGETAFPEGSQWSNPKLKNMYDSELSECAKGSVAFKPRRGDGLLFWSIQPDGKTEDPASMHEGCPVIKGAKWTTTIWIHNVPFRPADPALSDKKSDQNTSSGKKITDEFVDPGICKDSDEGCDGWGKSGECEKNVDFMHSMCRAACKICTPCLESDHKCYWDNREKQGYLVFSQSELDFRRTKGSG